MCIGKEVCRVGGKDVKGEVKSGVKSKNMNFNLKTAISGGR